MHTTKAVVQTVAKSPVALVTSVASIFVVVFLVNHIWLSKTSIDDLLLLLGVAFFTKIFYLQSDYALGLVEWLYPVVVWRIPTRQPQAALTIDDVPLLNQPTDLEQILDVLKKHEVKATLFVMSGFTKPPEEGGMESSASERCLALLKRAVAEGHELANHMMFDRPAIVMSSAEFDAAFQHCDALIAELQGGEKGWAARPRRWFRPASALWNMHILAVAKKTGYTTVISNCYPHDVASVTRHINVAYLSQRARPGAVIVVHDRWHTAATLDKALPEIAKRGIQLGTLSALQDIADAEQQQDGIVEQTGPQRSKGRAAQVKKAVGSLRKKGMLQQQG